jgi:hypothetical protein
VTDTIRVVYVGRACAEWIGHPLGNPFHIGKDGTRAEVLAEYRAWLAAKPAAELNALLSELWEQTDRGRSPLGCWCHPEDCHADLLAELLAERFGTPAGVTE